MTLERQIEDLQALHASQWFERLKEGRPEDVAAFREWCAQSPVHIREFLEISWIDREAEELDPGREEDLEALLREIRPGVKALQSNRNITGRDIAGNSHGSRRPWALAAVMAVCALGLGWYGRSLFSGHEYATRIGELRTIELSDRSVVTLNTDSRIRIAYEDDARDIELDHGEAVFKVARDQQRPFRVHTRAGVIQALGTQFNVYDRPEGIEVSVLEGRVRLTPLTNNGQTSPLVEELMAGQEACIGVDGNIRRAAHADIARVAAWSKRRLKFDNTPLDEIVREFNRYHQNLRLRLEGIPVGSHPYTGIFDADDPGTLARFLEQEPNLVIKRGDGEIVIRAR